MRVYRLLLDTKAEGPGNRACIWVSGCNHGCNGCFAEHLWDYSGGEEMSAQEVINILSNAIDDLDGVTFLGGEPFDQAEELSEVAAYVKSKGKNIISFSGYLYENLITDGKKKKLLMHTDLLCDGPFIEELTDYSRPLLGSSNQRYIFLTDAISEKDMAEYKNRFEVRIHRNGKTEINGMGNIQKLRKLYLPNQVKERGKKDGFTNI